MASYSKASCLSQHCYGKALVLVPDIASRRRSVPTLSARRSLGLAKRLFFFFVRINTNACTDHIPNVENSKLRIHLNVEMGAPKD